MDSAETYLRSVSSNVERRDARLCWPHHHGKTELLVEPIKYRTRDKLEVSELVTLTHTCPPLANISPSTAALLNRWATLSSLIPGDATQPARLVCKAGIFAEDRAAAERVYAPLVCTEAAVLGWYAAMLANGSFTIDPENSPPIGTRDVPPFSADDFDACREFGERFGYLGFANADGLSMEFPWDAGAVCYALDDARTSLLTLRTTEVHGLYGRGVLAKLELPLPHQGDQAVAVVDELNRWEFSGIDLPPLFGSWCVGPRAPTFVTFIPNQMALPGLLQNLTAHNHQRARRVREWLYGGEDRSSGTS